MHPALVLALYLWLSPSPSAPSVALTDLNGFPDATACTEALAFLKARQTWLEAQASLHGADPWWVGEWQAARDDNAWRLGCWDTLDGAQTNRRCQEARCKAMLADLREVIGRREYALRRMPVVIDRRFCWK